MFFAKFTLIMVCFQIQLGDENYVFEGNTDYSSTKSVDFPWPILATMFRVYPLNYVGGIEMSMKLYGYTDGKLN